MLIILSIISWWLVGRAIMWTFEFILEDYSKINRSINLWQFLFGRVTNSRVFDSEFDYSIEIFLTIFWPFALLIGLFVFVIETKYEQLSKIGTNISKFFNFLFGWTTKPIFTLGSKNKQDSKKNPPE